MKRIITRHEDGHLDVNDGCIYGGCYWLLYLLAVAFVVLS